MPQKGLDAYKNNNTLGMKHKVYYGEYSLQHWIDLMLSGDIELPVYQRYFVWDEDMAKSMILNLKKNFFVPPVIIGAFNTADGQKNLILDGQQRLTTLLLAKLKVFPDKSKFASTVKQLVDENDDPVENDETYTAICDWKYEKLINGERKIDKIMESIDKTLYKTDVDYQVGGDFFTSHYLGFCYLVPDTTIENAQQKYYSTLFRNINAQGVALIPQESRESLYFLDSSKSGFFKPDFIENINIKSIRSITHIDYARFLALLANYKTQGAFNQIAVGQKKDFEPFYEDYIVAVVDDTDSPVFGHFSEMFPIDTLQSRLDSLRDSIENLGLREKTYSSIIFLDLDFFGLIYHVLFEGRTIDFTQKVQLQSQIQQKAKRFKNDKKHSKNPASVTHLRNRIKESVNTYKKFLV